MTTYEENEISLKLTLWLGSKHWIKKTILKRGSCGCDCMVVGFTSTCAISAYPH